MYYRRLIGSTCSITLRIANGVLLPPARRLVGRGYRRLVADSPLLALLGAAAVSDSFVSDDQ